MALRTQKIHIPLGAGLDQKTDEYLVQPPKAGEIVNGRFDKRGAVTRRHVVDSMSNFGLPVTGYPNKLFPHHDTLCMFGPDGIYRYDGPDDKWIIHGNLVPKGPAEVKVRDLFRRNIGGTNDISGIQVAIAADYICYAWVDSIGSQYMILDAATGTVIQEPVTLPSLSQKWTMGSAEDMAFLIFDSSFNGTNYDNRLIRIDPVNPASYTNTLLGTSLNKQYFLSSGGGAGYLHVVWDDSVSNNVRAAVYDGNGNEITFKAGSVPNTDVRGALFNDVNSRLFISCYDNATVKYIVGYFTFDPVTKTYTDTTWVTDSTFSLSGYLGKTDDTGNMMIIWGQKTSSNVNGRFNDYYEIATQGVTPGGAPSSAPVVRTYNHRIVSEPAYYDGTPIFAISWVGSDGQQGNPEATEWISMQRVGYFVTPVTITVNSNPQYVLVCLGKFSVDYNVVPSEYSTLAPKLIEYGGWIRTGFERIAELDPSRVPSTGAPESVSELAEVRFRRDLGSGPQVDPVSAVEVNGISMLSGANPCSFDGYNSFESQFYEAPEGFQFYGNSSYTAQDFTLITGSKSTTGVYHFKQGTKLRVVWFWYDAQGNLHRSPVSQDIPFTVESGDAPNTDYEQAILEITKPSDIGFLRGGSTETEVLFRVYELDGTQWTAVTDYLRVSQYTYFGTAPSSPAKLQVFLRGASTYSPYVMPGTSTSFTDTLYTDGGELEAYSTPGLICLIHARNRLWGISMDDPTQVIVSKITSPKLAPEFAGELTINAPEKLTALSVMDDKIIAFSESGAYYIVGDGPNNLGEQGSFVGPLPIHGGLGTDNYNSVVEVPQGLLFKAPKGIYLLDRGLNLEFVGAPVEDEMSNRITSAVLVPDQGEVRFTTTPNTVGGVQVNKCLVYNYLFNEWSTYDNYGARSAAIVNGKYYLAVDYPVVRVEDITRFSRNDTFTWTTPWIALDNIQGFKRIRNVLFLGHKDSSDFKVEVGYDYESTFSEVYTWPEAEVPSDPMQIRLKVGRPKCQAIRFRFTNFIIDPFNPPGDGAGVTIVGINLEAGILRGPFRHIPPSGTEITRR